MERKHPRVSVILPSYNSDERLIVSVKSVLNQTFDDLELIVVDDGSDGRNAKEILEGGGIDTEKVAFLTNKHNLGIQKTLNKGLKEAKGEYIARIDDDNEWIDKDKLKLQVEFLDSHPEYVLVGCGVVYVDENNQSVSTYIPPKSDERIRSIILSRNCFVHSSVVFRYDVVVSLGGYDETRRTLHVEDYDLWLRLGALGKIANIPVVGVQSLVHKSSISSRNLLTQIRRVVGLTKRYGDQYPGFYRSLLRGYVRLIRYSFAAIVLGGHKVRSKYFEKHALNIDK